jgi:flagellar motor switch protein FliN/FliY
MNEAINNYLKQNLKESIVSVLTMLLGKEIKVEIGDIEEGTKDIVVNKFTEYPKIIFAEIEQKESKGSGYFLFNKKLGGFIANLMVGVEEEKDEIKDEDIDALNETMNQVSSSLALGIKEASGKNFGFNQAKIKELDVEEIYNSIKTDEIFYTESSINIEGKQGRFIFVLSPEIVEYLIGKDNKSTASSVASKKKIPAPKHDNLSGGTLDSKLSMLFDVELPIIVRIGKTSMYLKNILKLGIGSIVQLDKIVDEPVELLVNNKLIARGEVVVVESNFALRITEIVSREERIKSLG